MKPKVSIRSTAALALGCALAALPLAVVSAQDSSSTSSHTSTVDPNKTATEQAKLSGTEQKFMMEAGAGNAAEIQLAELALKNGENPKVKEFAQMMIKDHTQANEELDKVAQREQITDFKPEPNAEDKALYEKMTALKGKAFDEAYAKNAVEDHSKDLDDYKGAHISVTNKGLLAYVNKTEAVVAHHLKMAKELEKSETKG